MAYLKKLISDNMPFSSQEFVAFARSYEFERAPSYPEYPQSNGKVENATKTIKLLIKKTKGSYNDFYLALLEWRNTPSEGMDSSPAQRMFGLRMKTLLPTSNQLLQPETQKGVSDKLRVQKIYNQNISIGVARSSQGCRKMILSAYNQVHKTAQDARTVGKILKKADIRSYIVQTNEGQILRRNRKFLRTSKGTSIGDYNDLPDPAATVNDNQQENDMVVEAVAPQTNTAGKQSGKSDETRYDFRQGEAYQPLTTRSGRKIVCPDYYINKLAL